MYAITYKTKLRTIEVGEVKGILIYQSLERTEREVAHLKKIFPRDKNKFAAIEFNGDNGYYDD